ncbi:MAG: fumarate hydratase C-terminal domain-containing protein [Candidatus Krumholzibacteriota bacterium]|nr:fumarate hydratase C-terminal domain-containing protein [Candidatus Krumholzibacteriota bacterium]
MSRIDLPVTAEQIAALHVGDMVTLNGVMVTARDAGHKYLIENFVEASPPESEKALGDKLTPLLENGVIYHCGPIVKQDTDGTWHIVAAGPTTSIREEPYQARIIERFGVRGVIGKGGMGSKTRDACQAHGAVYLHAVGGAASLLANHIVEVLDVFKEKEFGLPEAFWVIRVEEFPALVTIDSHGKSLHEDVEAASASILDKLADDIRDH